MDPSSVYNLFPHLAPFDNAPKKLFKNRVSLEGFDEEKVQLIESRQKALEEYIDESEEGFLGLEYVYEVLNLSGRGYYYCCLCRAKCYMSPGVSMSIVTHLYAYNHIILYLQDHFKAVYKNIMNCRKEKRKAIATRISADIRNFFGRLQITQIHHRDFTTNRNCKILSLKNGPHYPEYPHERFLKLVVKYNHDPEIEAETCQKKRKHKDREEPKTYIRLEDYKSPSATKPASEPSICNTSSQSNVVNKTENSIQNDTKFERESNIWTCKRITDEVEEQIERDFKRHMENPEEHPDYSKEWSKYWREKYQEFKRKGINMFNYDLEPEWKEFWKQRMIQLYLQSKENLSKLRTKTQEASKAYLSCEKPQDNAVIFLNVLKLLIALEEYLGSYARQINDLCAKATRMQIERGQNLEDLINGDNYILLKNVNEHLRGQLQAGLVHGPMENVFRTALRSIDKLIEIFIRKNKRMIDEIVKGLMTAPGVREVDRVKILQAIVDKLSAQGKTHTTEEELTQLIKELIKELVQTPSTSSVSSGAETMNSIPSTSSFTFIPPPPLNNPANSNELNLGNGPAAFGTNYNPVGPTFNPNLPPPPPQIGQPCPNPMGAGPFGNQPMVGGNNFVWGGAQNQFAGQRMNVPPPVAPQQMIAYPKMVPCGARFSDFRRGSGVAESDSGSNAAQKRQYDESSLPFSKRFDNSRRY